VVAPQAEAIAPVTSWRGVRCQWPCCGVGIVLIPVAPTLSKEQGPYRVDEAFYYLSRFPVGELGAVADIVARRGLR
jgi:hypothetical protein